MTAPLPHALFNVVSTTEVVPTPSDPADIIYERVQALHNFWKVHNAQSRTSRDAPNIRSCHLFWRVWSDTKLALTLNQSTLIRLWMQCQQDLDLSPFELRMINSSTSTNQESGEVSSMEFRPKKQSSDDPHQSRTSPSISPSQDGLNEEGLEDLEISSRRRKSSTDDQKRPTASSRPSLNRSTSGSSNGNRKRTSYQSVTSRGRSRPSMTRKRSSQSQQTPESSKNRPSIRSPQPSKVESTSTNETRKLNKTQSAETTTGSNTTKESSRRISSFGLPSASSWQSDESHADSPALPTGTTSSSTPSSLVIDKNFRKKFVETQKKFQSSTDPTNSTFRRTGSIVRFADEIDLIDPFRKQPDQSSSSHQRTPSESQSGHPQSLLRHDSTGSVAAISDDESDNNSETTTIALPRVTSQLSLGIAHLKRSQNTPRAGPDNSVNNEPAARLTSPSLRMEQTESTREDMTTRPSEEDETGKLLAMGWKDGVTRAGGVNLPSPLVVKGDIQDGGSGNAAFEGVEESIL